jgi:hypothetical protein
MPVFYNPAGKIASGRRKKEDAAVIWRTAENFDKHGVANHHLLWYSKQ